MKYLPNLLLRTERFLVSSIHLNNIPFILLIFTIIVTGTGGCEDKPEIIGRELIPDSLLAYYNTSELIHTFTVESDSVVTNQKYNFLLGQNIHDLFGETTARLVTQINLVEAGSYSYGPDPRHDSVVLTIDFTDYTGDPVPQMNYSIYEFEEEIRTDTSMYSNAVMEGRYNPALLGTGEINLNDSTIKIKIEDQNIINKFFNAPDTVFQYTDYLQDYIKGFYIVPERISGNGAMVNLNFSNRPAILAIYYYNEEEDSLSYFMEIGAASRKYNLFDRDFENYPVDTAALNNGDEPDKLVYIGSPAGMNGIIRFPDLSAWRDSMPVAINNARLIITPADTIETGLSVQNYPESLNLYTRGEDGLKRYVYDYMLNSSTFGGAYNSETNSYSFNIKVHIQSYLNGDLENLDLILEPASQGETYKQLIIYGGTAADTGRMRLEIVYTDM